MSKSINNHCDVGNHDVGEMYVSLCAICERRVCHAHQGNPDALGGSYVGCIDHKAEVDEMNRVWWQKARAHYGTKEQSC